MQGGPYPRLLQCAAVQTRGVREATASERSISNQTQKSSPPSIPQRLESWSTSNSPNPPGSSVGGRRAQLERGAAAGDLGPQALVGGGDVHEHALGGVGGAAVDDGVVDELGDDDQQVVELAAGGDAGQRVGDDAAGGRAGLQAAGQLDGGRAHAVVRPRAAAQLAGEQVGAPARERLADRAPARALRRTTSRVTSSSASGLASVPASDRVAERVDLVGRGDGRRRQPLEAAVERLAAQLDQPVAVEHERRARRPASPSPP